MKVMTQKLAVIAYCTFHSVTVVADALVSAGRQEIKEEAVSPLVTAVPTEYLLPPTITSD